MVTVFGYGNDVECVSHWRRGIYVSVLGNMGSTLVFLLRMFEMCNCDLTHGRYVIGGGTGELPPKEMNISVLGCVAC